MKPRIAWLLLVAVGTLAIVAWSAAPKAVQESETPETENISETPKPSCPESPTTVSPDFFWQRVAEIEKFQFEGFRRVRPPRSQTATVPPVWTGEKIRGESDQSPLSQGAILGFASDDNSTLILVDIAYVSKLTGRGILRTAWMDEGVVKDYGACEGCTGSRTIQFYEPGVVYTVTSYRLGVDKTFYPFTAALMKYLVE
ncbi:MAG TPA: hypothetical protein VD969_15145 [Symbiobacteriaceae bacterium]|nr:hypothetical protein [Symbiobacteriaceae bacterium]